MGTTDRDSLCGSCGCDYKECPGHFGHIELAKPVFHGGYVTTVMNVLRCICVSCSCLKIRDATLKKQIGIIKSGRTRFKKMKDACMKLKECQKEGGGCGQFQPNYRKIGLQIMREEPSTSGPVDLSKTQDPKRIFKPEEIRKIFEKIKDEDLKLMGFDPKQARPEWMIIQALAVAPPPVRPSVQAGDGVRSEDDLTYAYRMIVRTNNELRRFIETGQQERVQDDVHRNLQLHIATLMDNNIIDMPTQRHSSSGKKIKDIRSRLKGKEGRVRGNLMGKRVDFSARSVITPDPILKLDQLGVPEAIAKNLTVPEYVTRENMAVMKQLVANGPEKWPGAKYIIRHDGRQIDLSNLGNRANAHLDPGYIVERQLMDNDFVIFNRQPSLHKMSMMGHRVKVLPFCTFRLNLSVTAPYNADFDGDEMNMHVPQNYETKAEIKEIMHVPKQIVAPKDNKPVMGIFQDSCIGVMLMSTRDTFIEMDVVLNLLLWVDYNGELPPPAIIKPRPLWTGKQLLQLVIPNQITYQKINDDKRLYDNTKDDNVIIKNGEFLSGRFRKDHVGAAKGGLVHVLWKDIGPDAACDWFSHTQNIVNNWLITHGFTMGVQDIIAPQQTVEQIQELIIKYKRKVQKITQKTNRGKLETLPGMGMQQSFENEVNVRLRKALDEAGSKANKSLTERNRLKNMVFSGSKGSNMNISQIMACVGQQNVEGKRIPFGFNRRSLPHFSKDDYGPESKGFVSNCYVSGLTPQEFFFHAMGGREGLIDTACKTAETGYIQRRLIKALEDVQVKYDQTVRTSRDQILQFLYGEDGMAAEYIENLSIPLIEMSNKQAAEKYKFFEGVPPDQERVALEKYLQEDTLRDITDIEKLTSKLKDEFDQIMKDRSALRTFIFPHGEKDICVPINVQRIILRAKQYFEVPHRQKTALNPEYVVDKVKDLCEKQLKVYPENKIQKSPIFDEANQDATWLFKMYLRTMLCAKHVIQTHGLNKQAFDFIVGEIKERFDRSLVNPGEMVGCIGAQSMGEPATQMTLNTFHSAGVASKNVTLGVPRLKEVINVAKTIKTPSVRVLIEERYMKNDTVAHEIGNTIEHSTLSHVVASSGIYYDPNPKETIIHADKDLLEFYNDTVGFEDASINSVSPWVIRFELDFAKMISRDLTMKQIDNKLQDEFSEGQINIVRHYELPPNSNKMVLRIRIPEFQMDEEDEDTVPQLLKQLEDRILNHMTLKGIPEITKVAYTKSAPQCKFNVFNPVTQAMEKSKDNWIIETDGVALKKILAVDKVDKSKTVSNDIIEVLTVLGIEATRNSIINELRFVLNSYGIYVNYRHLSTLCDIMTNRGIITAITRHGINRVDSGALRKSSFEETVEILLEASQHAEVDVLSGISENIIFGQLANYGTGCFDLIMDTKELQMAKVNNDDDFDQPMAMDWNQDFDNIASTPDILMTPDQPFLDGATAYDKDKDGSFYNAFTPMPMATSTHYGVGVSSPIQGSPTHGDPFRMNQGATPIYAGATPGPAAYSYEGTQGYMRQGAGTTPAYPSSSPGYYQGAAGYSTAGQPMGAYQGGASSPGYKVGQSPGYRPTAMGGASPSYRPQVGGATPGYAQYGSASPGYRPTMQAASPGYRPPTMGGGASPGYRPTAMGGASPAYGAQGGVGQDFITPGGYSPTGGHYGGQSYNPWTPGEQPDEKKDEEKK